MKLTVLFIGLFFIHFPTSFAPDDCFDGCLLFNRPGTRSVGQTRPNSLERRVHAVGAHGRHRLARTGTFFPADSVFERVDLPVDFKCIDMHYCPQVIVIGATNRIDAVDPVRSR